MNGIQFKLRLVEKRSAEVFKLIVEQVIDRYLLSSVRQLEFRKNTTYV